MPHAWLTSGSGKVSTLDLINYGRLLVLAPAGTAGLGEAVDRLHGDGYPIDLAIVGAGAELQPADASFLELFGDDVLLVRPDGHIAARFAAAAAAAGLSRTAATLFPRR